MYGNSKCQQVFENEEILNSDNENDSSEIGTIKLELDENGKLVENNQVLDYIYRDKKLNNLTFYNFSRCVRLEKNHSQNHSIIVALPCYIIKAPHQLCQTHELVLYLNPNLNLLVPNISVPRVIGCSIPQPSSKKLYAEFMLAHFKPFSVEMPLVNVGETLESTYHNYCFDSFSCDIIANWEAVHECEDEWNAERICKQAQLTKPSHLMKQTFKSVLEDDWEIDIAESSKENSIKDLKLIMRLQLLENSNWFSQLQTHPHIIHANSTQPTFISEITSLNIKQWKAEAKSQEKSIAQARINALNPKQQ